jgi:hypothetical protein
MDMSQQIRDILGDIGYNLQDHGKEFRARPIYRDSDSNTVLRIRKDNGNWVDFKENISGRFEELVKISLNLSSIDDAKQYLSDKIVIDKEAPKYKPRIVERRILSQDFLKNLKKDNSYWNNRGISDDTLEVFGGGICNSGKMVDRYIFPVFDYREKLVGVSGRYVHKLESYSKIPKWKHIGDKFSWNYPLKYNIKILKNLKTIILVESIGDMLSLWEAGIKNVIVIFGLNLSTSIQNTLLRLDPDRVIISLNNDQLKKTEGAGNNAAYKIERRLLTFFDRRQLKIYFPTKNDFGEMSKQEILEWAEKI